MTIDNIYNHACVPAFLMVYKISLLADKEDPIYIEAVSLFKNNAILYDVNFSKSKNVVQIFTHDFDSMIVQTYNFIALHIPNTLNQKHGYITRIYPVERLYELDKVPFRIRRKTLTYTSTKEYENIRLNFKKLED